MKPTCPRCRHKQHKKVSETGDGSEYVCGLCGRGFFVRHVDLIPMPSITEAAPGPVYLRYGRISSLSDGSLAKEKQDADTLEFGKRHLDHKGFTDGGFWFDESVSGSTPFLARPAAATLWRCAKKGDCIVVSKLDRAFRSCSDALKVVEYCEDRGIGFQILNIGLDTTSPMGKLVLTVMAGIAEMERQNTVIRNREDVAARRASGRPIAGVAPHGWKVVRTENGAAYRVCEASRKRCIAALVLYEEGFSLQEVSNILACQGMFAKKGKPYHHDVLSKMVRAAQDGFPDPKTAYATKVRGSRPKRPVRHAPKAGPST